MPADCPILVDETWVASHPDAILADVRWYLDGRDGREAFETKHIAGAIFVDLDSDLSGHGRATDGRHPLPSPEGFAANLGRIGIGEHDTVVAYDDPAAAPPDAWSGCYALLVDTPRCSTEAFVRGLVPRRVDHPSLGNQRKSLPFDGQRTRSSAWTISSRMPGLP